MNDFTDGLKERLNNSVTGPYTMFFLIINWKITLFAFTGVESSKDRIDAISAYLTEDKLYVYGVPILATFLYLTLSPLLVLVLDTYKEIIEIRKLNKIESLNAQLNSTWDYKFSLVKQLAGKILLSHNAMIQNSNPASNDLKKLAKYLSALQESNGKDILGHFSELRKDGDI